MYWALSLPWAVGHHEQVRDQFIKNQDWASRRVERFGYTDIQNVYCYTGFVHHPEQDTLPLVQVRVEIDPTDFVQRHAIHHERAENLSDSLLGTPVEFLPRWGASYMTSQIVVRSWSDEDGAISSMTDAVSLYNEQDVNPSSLCGHHVMDLVRKWPVAVDRNYGSARGWTEIHFDQGADADSIFCVAQQEFLRSPAPELVHGHVTILDFNALIPMTPLDEREDMIQRINIVRGNLLCLRGGAMEVGSFVECHPSRYGGHALG